WLAPHGIACVSAGELNWPVPAETGHMFAENAAIKAHAAAKATGLPAFSDDSGLCVAALDGAPGLISADWAVNKDFGPAMEKVERELQKRGATTPEQRRAYFVSALVVAWPDGEEALFEGRVHGTLVWPPRGLSGFGYDPMFVPDRKTKTFGEMTSDEKHGLPRDGGEALSHRARAFQHMERALFGRDTQ
ncbi:MAG: non-canonical purine NTP pyrophosphatase, partial [Beijerinckiaceae bacterium]